ncbi:MAG: pseudouridine synthase [Saprospiraceae bacterium]|jgi:23S rRNA pseudouridine2457 synthase|nr:pseudouridine synthase [Saprospiraceae bacterium]
MDFKYYVFYKPYNVLTQFTKEREDHNTLSDYLNVEKDVYPVGRLDKDSEGLLLLTNDKSINDKLLNPIKKHKRSYFVQVENEVSENAIDALIKGVDIKLEKGSYRTKPCSVKKLSKPPVLPERNPPIRVRQNIPTSWALIELTEGKNRQVRKMFASVGFPVLRLVRTQIEDLKLNKLDPGKYYTLGAEELCKLLNIELINSPKIKKNTSSVRKSDFTKSETKKPSESKPIKGSYLSYRGKSRKK